MAARWPRGRGRAEAIVLEWWRGKGGGRTFSMVAGEGAWMGGGGEEEEEGWCGGGGKAMVRGEVEGRRENNEGGVSLANKKGKAKKEGIVYVKTTF